MLLYHGSNTVVERPEIRENLRALDFGAGFYLTSSREQAAKWAKTVTKRRRKGAPVLNAYELDQELMKELNILQFQSADASWLDFVVANRKERPVNNIHDLVIGPVANDSTLPVIDDYMDGKYTREQAVERLLPQNLTDQYAFLTRKALSYLRFKGEKTL